MFIPWCAGCRQTKSWRSYSAGATAFVKEWAARCTCSTVNAAGCDARAHQFQKTTGRPAHYLIEMWGPGLFQDCLAARTVTQAAGGRPAPDRRCGHRRRRVPPMLTKRRALQSCLFPVVRTSVVVIQHGLVCPVHRPRGIEFWTILYAFGIKIHVDFFIGPTDRFEPQWRDQHFTTG